MKLDRVNLDLRYWELKKEQFLKIFSTAPVEAAEYFYQELLPFYFMTNRKSYSKLPDIVSRLLEELSRAGLVLRGNALVAKALYSAADPDLLPVPLSGEEYLKPMEELALKVLPELSSSSKVYKSLLSKLKKILSKEPDGERYYREFERYYRLYEMLKVFKTAQIDAAIDKAKEFLTIFKGDLLGEFLLIFFIYFKEREGRKLEIKQSLQRLFSLAKEQKDTYLACRIETLWGELEPASAISYFEHVKDELIKLRLYHNLATFLTERHLPLVEKDPGVGASEKLGTKLLAAEAFLVVNEKERAYELYRSIFKELLALEDYNTLISIIERDNLLDKIPDEDIKKEFLNVLIEAYQRVVAVNPSNLSALMGYAKALERAGRTDEVKDIYFKLGTIALREYEYYEKAEEAFRKLLEIEPDNLEALEQLVNVLLRDGARKEEAIKLILDTIHKLRDLGRTSEAEALATKYKDLLPSEEKQQLEREQLLKLYKSGDKEGFVRESLTKISVFRDDEEMLSSFLNSSLEILGKDNYRELIVPIKDLLKALPQDRREHYLKALLRKLIELEMTSELKELLQELSDLDISEDFKLFLKPVYRLVIATNLTDKEFLRTAVKFYASMSDTLSKKIGLISIANTLIMIAPEEAIDVVRALRESFPGDLDAIELEMRLYYTLKDFEELERAISKAADELKERRRTLLKLLEDSIWKYKILRPSIIDSYLKSIADLPEEERKERFVALAREMFSLKRFDLLKLLGDKMKELNVYSDEIQDMLIQVYSKERDIEKLLSLAEHSLLQVSLQGGWYRALGKLLELMPEVTDQISPQAINTLISIFNVVLDRGKDEELSRAERMITNLLGSLLAPVSFNIEGLPKEALELFNLLLRYRLSLQSNLIDDLVSKLIETGNVSVLKQLLQHLSELPPDKLSDELQRLAPSLLLKLLTQEKLVESEELLSALSTSLESRLEELAELERGEAVRRLIELYMDREPEKVTALLSEHWRELPSDTLLMIVFKLPSEQLESLPLELVIHFLESLESEIKRMTVVDVVERMTSKLSLEDAMRVVVSFLSKGYTEVLRGFRGILQRTDSKLALISMAENLGDKEKVLINSLIGFWDDAAHHVLSEGIPLYRGLLDVARGLAAGGYQEKATELYSSMIKSLEDKLFSGTISPEEEELLSLLKYEMAELLEESSKERALEIYADLYVTAPQLAELVKVKMEKLQSSLVQ